MAKDNLITNTFRLNMNNPTHVKINNVLKNLNPKIYKSRNQFLIDAAVFFIEHYGDESFMECKEVEEIHFVTQDVEFLEKKIEQYYHDLDSSKEEYEKPFAYKKELQEKLARQFELNAQLDLENAKVADADLGGLDESKDSPDSNVAERDESYRTNQDGKSR